MIWRAAVPVVAGLLLAILPAPEGLDQAAWYYAAVFTSVILAVITEPLPRRRSGSSA